MWEAMLKRILSRYVVDGELSVTWPDGSKNRFGSPSDTQASVRLTDNATVRRLCLTPEMALGEGYMNGTVVLPKEELVNLLKILVRNLALGDLPAWVTGPQRLQTALRRIVQRNSPQRSLRNVAHHYDLSDDLYRLFLDEDMQYSCAYFTHEGMSLDAAQSAKKAHIAAKLRIEPGMRVLDIGCGWGGMGLTLARDFGARVTGITLSENQLATARARARAAGLEDRVNFELMDYRKIEDRFDRIVSVGMLEHVGSAHFGEYFKRVGELLNEDGVALIHTIGRCDPPTITSDWITRYIFPGGYIPSLSDLAPAIEQGGFWLADLESLRWHYAETLRRWRLRFEDRIEQVRAMYDERFVRMWRYYLVACEVAFLEQHQVVYQFQLAKKIGTVPYTRDYLYQAHSAYRRAAE